MVLSPLIIGIAIAVIVLAIFLSFPFLLLCEGDSIDSLHHLRSFKTAPLSGW